MFLRLLKKDCRLFFMNKSNAVLMLLIPPLLILLFGFTLDNYMSGDFKTFDDGKVLYFEENASQEILDRFNAITVDITAETGVTFEQTDDYEKAKQMVEKSEAFAVIKITENAFDYYRSPYNETEGGRIVRSLFAELAAASADSTENVIVDIELDIEKVDAKPYYTFGGLGFALLITSYLFTGMYVKEKALRTKERIAISPAGNSLAVLSKITVGLLCGIVQIAVSLIVATIAFDIKWEHNFGLIVLVFMMLSLFSSSLAAFAGTVTSNPAASQTLASVVAMMSGYLGGSVTPMYLLEKTVPVKYFVKLSPLYWSSKSLSNLYNNIQDESVAGCLIAITAVSAVMIVVTILLSGREYKKKHIKGV